MLATMFYSIYVLVCTRDIGQAFVIKAELTGLQGLPILDFDNTQSVIERDFGDGTWWNIFTKT
jgi:hypothetical protein